MAKDNLNPQIFTKTTDREITADEENEEIYDEFDNREIFDWIKSIKDPEHTHLTLEEINVVECSNIKVDNLNNVITVDFTPTIPHCSSASLIGLAIRVKLLRCLPTRFKVDVRITQGTHNSELAINKQLADKERVAAALENGHLMTVINESL